MPQQLGSPQSTERIHDIVRSMQGQVKALGEAFSPPPVPSTAMQGSIPSPGMIMGLLQKAKGMGGSAMQGLGSMMGRGGQALGQAFQRMGPAMRGIGSAGMGAASRLGPMAAEAGFGPASLGLIPALFEVTREGVQELNQPGSSPIGQFGQRLGRQFGYGQAERQHPSLQGGLPGALSAVDFMRAKSQASDLLNQKLQEKHGLHNMSQTPGGQRQGLTTHDLRHVITETAKTLNLHDSLKSGNKSEFIAKMNMLAMALKDALPGGQIEDPDTGKMWNLSDPRDAYMFWQVMFMKTFGMQVGPPRASTGPNFPLMR